MSNISISQLGSILGIWAHPDDETFMIGGMLYESARAGQRVIAVTATKGEAGIQDNDRWPAADLADIRTGELKAALEILGVGQHQWLGYEDGRCSQVDEQEAVDRIRSLITEHRPDTVITFAPDGLTGHDDHRAVSRWTTNAIAGTDNPPLLYYAVHTQELYDALFDRIDKRLNIYFNVTRPQLVPGSECHFVLNLSEQALSAKLRALQAMPSQYEAFFAQCSDQEAVNAFATEALILAK